MADNVIDSLSVNISAKGKGVEDAIDKVIKNLTKLNVALDNYSGASKYASAMHTIEDGLNNITLAVNKIDTEKLNNVAKSLNSLSGAANKLNSAFGNTGMSKASKDAQALDAMLHNTIKDFMKMHGTTRSVTGEMQELFAQFSKGITWKNGQFDNITEDGMKAYTKMWDMVERYATESAKRSAGLYSDGILDYMRQHKVPVHMPFDFTDVSGDVESARKKLSQVMGVGGWSFNNKEMGDIAEFVKEMNDAIGTSIPIGNEAQTFELLAEAVLNARANVSRLTVDADQLFQELVTAAGGVEQFRQQLASTNATVNVNPFTALSEGLRGLPTTVPDLTGVAELAANIGKLGGKKALAGIANLPILVSGLSSVNQLGEINVPDLAGLANLIASFNKLGGKKGTAAAANIQPMITSLQQLSQMSNLPFPDPTNLEKLANALSMLGRETTGKALQNIPQFANALKDLMTTLSTAPKVSRNVIDLANALANLASNGAKVGSATRSLSSGMSKIGNVTSKVMTRSKDLSSRIIQFGKNLITSGRNATSAGRSYSTLASKIGLLYAKFWMLLRVVRMFSGMIEVASALTEVQNVVDTTFGKMSYKIEEFSKSAIKGFGMSELSAKKYASQFQAMGTAMGITSGQVQKAQQFLNNRRTMEGAVVGYNKMSNSMADVSINLTKLAADMASFYDVEQETVAKALQSGVLAGQTRPLVLAA